MYAKTCPSDLYVSAEEEEKEEETCPSDMYVSAEEEEEEDETCPSDLYVSAEEEDDKMMMRKMRTHVQATCTYLLRIARQVSHLAAAAMVRRTREFLFHFAPEMFT